MNYNYNYYDNRVTKLLDEAVSGAAAEASSLFPTSNSVYSERLGTDSKGDLWIRTFLINTRLNKRGWSVAPDTIHKNVLSIIGKPLVIDRDPMTGRIDHPQWNSSKSASANLHEQSKYAIGTVERVYYDKETDSYYADSRITNAAARNYINSLITGTNKKIPIAVSPQLVYDPKTEHPNYYKNWELTHIAIVDNGAYGPQAKAIGTCNGDSETCQQQLQQIAGVAASASVRFAGPGPELGLIDIPECYRVVQAPPNGKRRGCLV